MGGIHRICFTYLVILALLLATAWDPLDYVTPPFLGPGL
jgi:hypothetical protein